MPSITIRFASAFYRGLWGTVREEILAVVVFIGGGVYWLLHTGFRGGWSWQSFRDNGWEGLSITVWAVGLLISYHAIRAAIEVARNIHQEPPGSNPSRIVTPWLEPIAPVSQNVGLKLSMTVGAIVAICVIASYFMWNKAWNREIATLSFSTEPTERANLHVVGERFSVSIPNDEMLTTSANPALLLRVPVPQIEISISNVGKNRTLGLYIVRAAVIVSPPLNPEQEEELFSEKRSEWAGPGLAKANSWYPADPPKVLRTYPTLLEPSDWTDLISGAKVFYVVTKSNYRDVKGGLPTTESCKYWSVRSRDVKGGDCFGHND